jgi:hypothetical protein
MDSIAAEQEAADALDEIRHRPSRGDGESWAGQTPAGPLCRLLLGESTPFRKAKEATLHAADASVPARFLIRRNSFLDPAF